MNVELLSYTSTFKYLNMICICIYCEKTVTRVYFRLLFLYALFSSHFSMYFLFL